MIIRKASQQDLESIIQLLADDKLGAKRENYVLPLPQAYRDAFQAIIQDPNQELMVLSTDERVIGTFQMTFIPYLTYQGRWRAQIEAVRIHKNFRGEGLGQKIFQWAIARAKERGVHLLQLTTDKQRPEAKRFYEKLGFVASHEGMKLHFRNED